MGADDKAITSVALQIRAFRPSDAKSISEILRDSTEAAQWPSESYAKLAASPGGVFLVCETSAHLVGFLAARQVADEAEILNIAVNRDFRRKGVASALRQDLQLPATSKQPQAARIVESLRCDEASWSPCACSWQRRAAPPPANPSRTRRPARAPVLPRWRQPRHRLLPPRPAPRACSSS